MRLPLTPLPSPEPAVQALELVRLHCLVLGHPQGPADDLAAYLVHGGALMQRVADRAQALAWFSHCQPRLWIVVIADAGPSPDETLAELRAVCRSRPALEARFVVIERGRRRCPRSEVNDVVSLDGSTLHRSVFLKAVALAAGQVAPDDPEEPDFAPDTMPAPMSIQEAGAQGRLVLVAEDNEVNQLVLRKQLALLGLTAQICGNGREALECLRRRDYPLLLTDLHMPEMDGYDLAVAIRGAEAGLRRMPIVALTANALKDEAKRCRALGMDDYLTKPMQLADLELVLNKWLPAFAKPTSALSAPAAPKAAAPTSALDVRVLESLVGGEPQVIAKLLQAFRLSAGKAATQMRVACSTRQAAEVATVAHRLKSAARSVGALHLGELCLAMEQAGQSGTLETLADLWPRFEAEMAAVDECLGSTRVRSSE